MTDSPSNRRRPSDRFDRRTGAGPEHAGSAGRIGRPRSQPELREDAADVDPGEPGELDAPRPPREPEPLFVAPPGVPVVHLKSAGYGSFIYERMVGQVEGELADGDLAAVVDKHGRLFGWGFFNRRSQLALRMFSHAGPMPTDDDIRARVGSAVRLRRDLLRLDETTDAYRLIHAEGDGLPGLIADRFGEYVVIELFSLAMFKRVQMIQDAIVDAGVNVRNFIVRADKKVSEMEGFRLSSLPENKGRGDVVIVEHGVKFKVELSKGHKTGFFCDQRDNRLALAALTPARRVLDMCCYTGGFACYAATLGKAQSVLAVDLDEVSLETAEQNAALNQAKVEFKHCDAFDFLRYAARDGLKWDVVVLDPSKFVPRRDMMEIGLKKYVDLNRLALDVIEPGGILLTCSCSGLVDLPTFVQTVTRAGRYAKRQLQFLRISGAGPDHPIMAEAPESGYLKAVWARVL